MKKPIDVLKEMEKEGLDWITLPWSDEFRRLNKEYGEDKKTVCRKYWKYIQEKECSINKSWLKRIMGLRKLDERHLS